MLRAMTDVVAEKGYGKVAVADVIERAGVSRKTFYTQFKDKEDCFLQAYDTMLAQIMAVVIEAYGTSGGWAERMRAGLQALLEFLANEPALARAGIVEVLAAGPRAIERYERALRGFVPFIEAGRAESRQALPENISEALVGGIAQVLYLRIVAGEANRLLENLDELVFFVLLPFLGHARAAKVGFPEGAGQ
jgi:AcrR family transcriptional regulator